ncbi:EamA family transporter [Microcella frigidaquae]|uniref:Drug/metabolite transporter (DMT)-like permease n=1 Tax=Microcella frigidaquae TaxID=424758 RepID=A0A840XF97_9MICO|nr:DMT family transporter [Microcella frigidaquae]MBB5617182.1 drug/metabolite transporter (DMT)-like permease [Microcella frigidaquae]NHN45118.1 DMT family transporter [Microcella frigidaquae]
MGYVYALLAAVLFGANGSVTKATMEAGLTPAQVTEFRLVGTAIIAGLVLLVIDRRAFRLPRSQWLIMIVLGVFGVALLQATYAAAVQLLPVGIALLLEYTAVVMVALVAYFIFREPVKARLWVAIAFVLLGLAVVAQVWASTLDALGVVLALAAAVCLALYFLIGERQVARTSPLAVSFWTMSIAAVFWSFVSGWWELSPGFLTTPVDLGGVHGEFLVPMAVPLAWNILLGSFAPFLLSLAALGRLPATVAGITASSEVVFAFAVAWIWLGEALTLVQVIGAAVVLAGVILAQTARVSKTVVDADLALATGPITIVRESDSPSRT